MLNIIYMFYRYVEVSICEWLDKKHADLESRGVLELSFRPFIHWLDIQMEEIVTQGLKQVIKKEQPHMALYHW